VIVAGILVLGFESIVALRIPFENAPETADQRAQAAAAVSAAETAGTPR
jgi:hypothetical protein